jgi:HAD superfamily hydrolase (TIGR01509 family)
MAPTLRAVCFDLDGLLVDTEPHYFEAHRSVFAEHGVRLTKEEYARRWIITGTRTADEVARLGLRADPEAMSREAKRRFRALVDRDLRPMPHARETLERAHARFRTALVTNTPGAEVELVLGRLGLAPHLDRVVARESYDRAKPAPDGYLAAARLLGAAPAECLALEDSPRGVRAAVAAGMPVVAVVNEMTRFEPPVGAVLVLDSLADLDLAALAAAWPPVFPAA